MKLGKRVRHARELRGLTQEKLAELGAKKGLTQANISALESRDSHTSTLLFALADLLDVNARWLQTGEGPSGLEAKKPVGAPDPLLLQLIDLWGQLSPDNRDVLLNYANFLHAKEHPTASPSNPFGKERRQASGAKSRTR
jgi:transcriptional regulator with XRE-family HTH domain